MLKLQRIIAVIFLATIILTSCSNKNEMQEKQKLIHPPNIFSDNSIYEIPLDESAEEKDSRIMEELEQEILRLEEERKDLESARGELEDLKLIYTSEEYFDSQKQVQMTALLEENLIAQEQLTEKMDSLKTNKQFIENRGLTPEEIEAFYAEENEPENWSDVEKAITDQAMAEQADTLEEQPNE